MLICHLECFLYRVSSVCLLACGLVFLLHLMLSVGLSCCVSYIDCQVLLCILSKLGNTKSDWYIQLRSWIGGRAIAVYDVKKQDSYSPLQISVV